MVKVLQGDMEQQHSPTTAKKQGRLDNQMMLRGKGRIPVKGGKGKKIMMTQSSCPQHVDSHQPTPFVNSGL